MIAATLVCAIACAALVAVERRRARGDVGTLRTLCKLIASLAFVLVGVLAHAAHPSLFGECIVYGLMLGMIGDLALLGDSQPAFVVGLVAFLLGHLAYIAGIAQLVPARQWVAPLAAVPLAVGAGALAYLWPRLGRMRVPVIGYVAVIATMMAGALAARGNGALCAGAALFFASDLAVARDTFVGKAFANKAWGLPAYYAGQLLIAWSLCA